MIIRRIFIVLVLALFCGCRCPEAVLIDLGPIPEPFLNQVPYKDGSVYRFRHSGGLIINFAAQRTTYSEYSSCGGEQCCDFLYKYQVDETMLYPDYPVFNFRIQLSGFDTVNYQPFVSIGRSSFCFPPLSQSSENQGYIDSTRINEKWYYYVLAIKNCSEPMFNKDSIYADSLWYNSESGIIRIVMTNGEYYQINE